MATSIADLLAHADRASRGADLTASAAAKALQHAGRLLADLGSDNDDTTSDARWPSVDALSAACDRAGTTFEGGPGRLVDLVAVVADAAGRLRRELTLDDRWTIAISTAFITRRCAAAIASSGPYAQVPQVRAVIDSSRDLVRAAAASPPEPDFLSGLQAPIAGGGLRPGLAPGRVVLESTAALLAEFRSRSRDPLTTTQLIGVCHAAESVYARLAESGVDAARPGAQAWRTVRGAIACLADVPDRRRPGWSPVLEWARRLDDALDAARPSDLADVRVAAVYLPQLANATSSELDRIQRRLVIGAGPRPLSEQHVADWLACRTTPATPTGLTVVSEALARADRAGRLLAAARTGPDERPTSRAVDDRLVAAL